MIPVRFILADLRRLWLGGLMIVLLIALATALGIAVNLQERALRLGSARAADRFDLVVGAAGSETQLVLSAVFLQASPLPLMPGSVLKGLSEDRRVAWAAPVGFGDNFEGMPIVGTTAEFVTDGGRLKPSEGRAFAAFDEAVIGARVGLEMGDVVKPMHGLAGMSGHTHTELSYRVVGRMPATGTPWDRAILVPIEAVWLIHGLKPHGDGAAGGHDDHDQPAPTVPFTGSPGERVDTKPIVPPDHIGPPWAEGGPGLPAIIVKGKTIADAYRLRNAYRQGATVGVFPAEVLTRLYGTLGDARLVLSAIAIGTEALVAAAVMLVTAVHLSQRRRQIGALRALGAPRAAIFAIVWIEIMVLIGIGVAAGVGIGFAAAKVMAGLFTQASGIALPVELTGADLGFAGLLLAVAALVAAIPAFLAYRESPAAALRG